VPLLCVRRAPVMRGCLEQLQVRAHWRRAPVMRAACPCYAWTSTDVPLLCVDNLPRPAAGYLLRRLRRRPCETWPVARPKRSDVDVAFVRSVAETRLSGGGWDEQLSFHPAVFCQLSLPYVTPRGNPPVWERRNGPYSLLLRPSMELQPDGSRLPAYPTGVVPRLILSWLTTEITRQNEAEKSREIHLGDNLTHFMRGIGLREVTGGRYGSITRLRKAMNRLFDAVITAEYLGDPSRDVGRNFVIADRKQLWWSDSDRNADQQSLMPSTIWLSEPFYNHLRDHPVPLSYIGLRELQPYGAQALDIYTWLCHRLSYLEQDRMDISWDQLRAQFGTTVADTRFGRAKFKTRFEQSLSRVLQVYDTARVTTSPHGIVLRKSPTHIPRTTARRALGS
jgi:hypothetical protein